MNLVPERINEDVKHLSPREDVFIDFFKLLKMKIIKTDILSADFYPSTEDVQEEFLKNLDKTERKLAEQKTINYFLSNETHGRLYQRKLKGE